MDLNNKTCGKCGKKYHHCSSCDTWDMPWLERGYCSKVCELNSRQFLEDRETFLEFYSTLTLIQRAMFEKFMYVATEERYEYMWEDWIKDLEEEDNATP